MSDETQIVVAIGLTAALAVTTFWFVLWRLLVLERQMYAGFDRAVRPADRVDRRVDAVGSRLDRHIDEHPGRTPTGHGQS